MTTLKSSQVAYQEAVEALKKDPQASPAQFRPGIMAQHNALKQKLPGLLAAFSNALHEHTLGFLVVGPQSFSWGQLATKEAVNGILIDSRGLYMELATDRLWNSMGATNRLFGPTQYSILDDELRGVGEKLTDEHINFPDYFNQPVVNTRPDLVDRIQAVMEKSFGLKYRILYIKKQITDAAATLDLQGTTVPVIITDITGAAPMNTASELAQGIFESSRYSIVDAKDGIDLEKNVQETFTKVKKSLKQKKNPSKDNTNNE